MGTCSTLFFSSDPEKETLTSRISLTPEQDQLQREKHAAVYDFIKDRLYSLYTSAPVNWRRRLQGSVQYGTQIRPLVKGDEYDIDLGIYAEQANDASYFEDDAPNYKACIQSILHEYREHDPDAEKVMVPDKNFCCRIHFRTSFHIDVVAYHHNTEDDIRLAATRTAGWSYSDPKLLYLWFKNTVSDDYHRARMRRMIKYLKVLATLHFKDDNEVRPSSIYLTVLCARMYRKLVSTGAIVEQDDDCLRELLSAMSTYISSLSAAYEEDPINKDDNICRIDDKHWKNFQDKINYFAETAHLANNSSNIVEASLLWGELFKQFMPQPASLALKSVSLPSRWILPEIAITATHKNLSKSKESINAIGPVGKKYQLFFKLINPNAFPTDALVKWTVRNHGNDAGKVNDLGHENNVKPLNGVVEEVTEYRGTHYMDCLVYSQITGALYGYRSVPVKVNHMGIELPPRAGKRARPHNIR